VLSLDCPLGEQGADEEDRQRHCQDEQGRLA
jgi:hypothetical protein